MVTLHETAEGLSPVLIATASDLGNHSGGLLRAAAAGALTVIDDNRVAPALPCWCPAAYIREVLAFVGIDPDSLPAVGADRDELAPAITQS